MIFAAIAIAAVVAVFLLIHRSATTTEAGWTAETAGNGYGTIVEADGSFNFPQAPNGVHYVTRACGRIDPAATITLAYRIEADPGVAFCPSSEPAAPSIGPTLYFQRAGDDWSGQGEYEAFRWWATFAAPMPVTPGDHVITAPLNGRWTAVETSTSDDNVEAFRAALANAARVGFTFGGGTGYGHGVYATGKARFTLTSLTIA